MLSLGRSGTKTGWDGIHVEDVSADVMDSLALDEALDCVCDLDDHNDVMNDFSDDEL